MRVARLSNTLRRLVSGNYVGVFLCIVDARLEDRDEDKGEGEGGCVRVYACVALDGEGRPSSPASTWISWPVVFRLSLVFIIVLGLFLILSFLFLLLFLVV